MEALRSESYAGLGTVFEIAQWPGGSPQLREASDKLSTLVYSSA
jgi:hypothetical protein